MNDNRKSTLIINIYTNQNVIKETRVSF